MFWTFNLDFQKKFSITWPAFFLSRSEQFWKIKYQHMYLTKNCSLNPCRQITGKYPIFTWLYSWVHDSFDGYFIEHFPCSLNCREDTTASFCVPNWGKTFLMSHFNFYTYWFTFHIPKSNQNYNLTEQNNIKHTKTITKTTTKTWFRCHINTTRW